MSAHDRSPIPTYRIRSCFVKAPIVQRRTGTMAAPRRVIEIRFEEDELAELEAIARSRTAPGSWVERARILLAYRTDPSCYAVGEAVGVTHQTVQRCLDRAVLFGVMAALDDSPRPGKAPQITDEAKAWLVSLACETAKRHGYPHELWTTRLLASHVREHAEAADLARRRLHLAHRQHARAARLSAVANRAGAGATGGQRLRWRRYRRTIGP